jgi:hypothetical protein
MVLYAHHLLAHYAKLLPLNRMGIEDALLMYLPAVALFSLLGGFAASLFRSRSDQPAVALPE